MAALATMLQQQQQQPLLQYSQPMLLQQPQQLQQMPQMQQPQQQPMLEVGQVADAAFGIASAAPVPLPAKLLVASLSTRNQQAARKALNYGLAVAFGVLGTLALLIAIGLSVSVARSGEKTYVADGRWYGALSVTALAVLPLYWLCGYVLYKNSECRGDIVGAAANLAPGRFGRAAQAYQSR
jgi:hypothetical protein